MSKVGYAAHYDPDLDTDRLFTDATARVIANWVRPGDSVLELGCATGRMTTALVAAGASVVAVDRERSYLDRAAARGLEGVTWIEGDISTFGVTDHRDGRRFDHVVVANVVHEVADPVELLAVAARHLAPWGLVHLSLQNPRSIHRLVGFATGVIDRLDEISDRGHEYETRGLFDEMELRRLGWRAGLVDVHHEGVMIKPMANDGLGALDDRTLDGFAAAARFMPAHAAMNYLIFRAAS